MDGQVTIHIPSSRLNSAENTHPVRAMGHLRPEGKRPLFTVVIGGLGTSTLLTLFVLPTIYQWIEQRRAVSRPPRKRIMETS